ncbi:MAG TPA: DUF3558 family protein, partial [Candidatus Limnocylindrales bacterium]
ACGASTTGTTSPGAAATAGAATTAGATTASAAASAAGALAASLAAVDTCALLPTKDINAATGLTFGAGAPDSAGQCTWRVGGASANNGDGQLVAAVQDQQLSFIKSTFSGGTDMTVSGHAAYWNPAQGLQSLWVDIGGGRLLVLSFDPVGPTTQAIAQKLAELAIAKL